MTDARSASEPLAIPGPNAWLGRHRRLVVGASVGAVLVAAALAAVLGARPPPPWRARFFEGTTSSEVAVERFTRHVGGYWGTESPVWGIGTDNFSAQWSTCLTLDRERIVRFVVAADDRASLYLADRKLVDTASAPPDRRTLNVAGIARLPAGTYPLRVDYVELEGPAKLIVSMAFDDEPLGDPPLEMLRPADDQGRCAH